MIPKSADGYSRLSKELQVAALIAGAVAGLILLASKLHAHVDLIDPGVDRIVHEAESDRHIVNDIERWDQANMYRPPENEIQKEQREFRENWDREFDQWYESRYDGPSGASYDNDKD